MRVTDPVCGRQLDLADALAFEIHEGWSYFFCSEACRDQFLAAPEEFADQPVSPCGRHASFKALPRDDL